MAFKLEKLRKLVAETPPFESTSFVRLGGKEEGKEASPAKSTGDADETFLEYDPSELRSRKDFLLKLGVPHDELFCEILERSGGTLPQKEFANFANLSSSTISRFLQEMEAEGQIERVTIGREKLVYLPDHAPPPPKPRSDEEDGTARV